ncbi:CopD family protein, partial [Amnibacterium endophyticum]
APASAVAAAATLVDLLLRGPRASGSGWAGALRLHGLGDVLTGGIGVALVVRLVLLVAGALLVARARRGVAGTAVLGAIAVGALTTVALLGHAAAGPGAAWLVPAAVVHLGAMTTWLGGLVLLAGVLLRRGDGAPDAVLLRRWPRLAFASVAALIVTGELQAFPTVVPLPALWRTDYGLLLLGKLGLVAVALALAVGAHRLLARGSSPHRLRRAVIAEAAVTAAVVAVTAVLTMQPTAAETYGPPAAVAAPLDPGRLAVQVASTRRGPTRLHLAPPPGVRLDRVEGSLSTEGVPGLEVHFERTADGGWRSTDAQTPLPGRWTLTLQLDVAPDRGLATRTAWDVW